MSAWLPRLGERLAEALNPIVVKEVRQGLRTRSFWLFFGLLLVVCLAVSLAFFAQALDGSPQGKGAFISYFLCLAVVQFFVIPYSAFRSMAREREEETWLLLTLTGLGPRRILAGKLASSVLQGLLYASAAAPFLVFSYQLNGVELPAILLAMVGALVFQVFLVAVAVSLATVAQTRLARAAMHFLVLGVLLNALFSGGGLGVALAESASWTSLRREGWLAVAATLVGLGSTGLLLFEAAASALALPTEDYARGPRLAFLFQLTALAGFLVLGWALERETELLAVGAVACAAHALLVGGLVSTDRDGPARGRWPEEAAGGLLRPGAWRGLKLTWLALAVSGGLFAALALAAPDTTPRGIRLVAVAAPAYALLYLGAAHLLGRAFKVPPAQVPALVRVVLLALLVLGTGVPPLVGALLGDAESPALNLLNPVLGLAVLSKHGDLLSATVPWAAALAVSVAAGVVVRRRDREAA